MGGHLICRIRLEDHADAGAGMRVAMHARWGKTREDSDRSNERLIGRVKLVSPRQPLLIVSRSITGWGNFL